MAKFSATPNPDISEWELRSMERSRKVASQGMVLLSNDGVLPLKNVDGKIALFGNGARRTVKGGTGSGDVNSRSVINVEQGLESVGFTVTTKGWMDRYDAAVETARAACFADFALKIEKEGNDALMHLFNCPFMEPPIVPVTKEDVAVSDTERGHYDKAPGF